MKGDLKNKLKERMKKIPIETKVKVAIENHFIHKLGGSLFMPASEEGEEYDEIMRINALAQKEAQPIIDIVLREIEKWKENGMPEKTKKD